MNNIKQLCRLLLLAVCVSSCNDFLERQPINDIAPEFYLTEESHLAAYTINMYSILPSHTAWDYGFAQDIHTDNQVAKTESNNYVPQQYRVP